jgi:uncharacterized protein YwgA
MIPEADFVIALLGTAGEIPSRTMLQKLVYLSGDLAGESLNFSPHYYGPYSADLQEDVEALVAAGQVEETVSILEAWQPAAFDVVQYHYRLTAEGQKKLKDVPARTRGVAARVVKAAHEADAWNQASLSLAAKLRHLRGIDPSVGDDQVPALARQFGWRMTDASARRGARMLEALAKIGSLENPES